MKEYFLPPIEQVYQYLKERSDEIKSNIRRKETDIQVPSYVERSSHMGLAQGISSGTGFYNEKS